jgi:two-component system OmpR family response regulator
MPSPRTSLGRPAVLGPARSVLRGELDKIGLPTLLTILEMERRTGILILQRPRQLGRLHVRDGQIIRARVEGQRRQTGAEAVYQLVTWTDGQFELWLAEVEGRDEIRERTAFLLMEGLRRQDEARGAETRESPDLGAAFAGL